MLPSHSPADHQASPPPYGRKVVRLSVIVPFFNVERYAAEKSQEPGTERRTRHLLLSERHVPRTVISSESFRAVVKGMVTDRAAFAGNDRVALIVGRYPLGWWVPERGRGARPVRSDGRGLRGCRPHLSRLQASSKRPKQPVGAAGRCCPRPRRPAGRGRRARTGRSVVRAPRRRARRRMLLHRAAHRSRRGLSQSHLRFVSPHAVASEGDSRKRIFSNPDQKATEDYITGRFG